MSTSAIEVIDAHTAEFSDADKALVERDRFDEAINAADLVRRTCRCGLRIYGVHQYLEHLRGELRKAGVSLDYRRG